MLGLKDRLELSEDIEGAGLGSLVSRASCRGKIWGSTLHGGGDTTARSRNSCKGGDSLVDGMGRFLLVYFSIELVGGSSRGPARSAAAWP